jgi:hypothetical protein
MGLSKGEVENLFHDMEIFFTPLLLQNQPRKIKFIYASSNNSISLYSLENQKTSQVNFILSGGLVRQRGMTPDALALLFCHELGHTLGGAPHKEVEGVRTARSSEGQADYYAVSQCLIPFFNRHPLTKQRVFWAQQNVVRLWGLSERDHGPLRVPVTLSQHPTPYCRSKTFLAALEGLERPTCWYSSAFEKQYQFHKDHFPTDLWGNTPLMESIARGGDQKKLDFLHLGPININQQNFKKNTALMLAIKFNQEEIIFKLLDLGARVDLMDDQGRTPLFLLALQGKCALVTIMLEKVEKSLHSDKSPLWPHSQMDRWNEEKHEVQQICTK